MGDFLLVIIELFSLGAFVLSQFTRLTDGQTDGQTLIGKTALHTIQRGKKEHSVVYIKFNKYYEVTGSLYCRTQGEDVQVVENFGNDLPVDTA